MGLDTVEFVMALERAFDLEIPDDVARRLETPGDVVAWLEPRVPATRQAIEATVRDLMLEEFGITSFNWTDRFIKDLGVN